MSTFGKTLGSYVPALIVHRLAANPRLMAEATAQSLQAAVLVIEMFGLTELTEYFSERDDHKTARAVQLVKACCERVIGLIAKHGGDIARFSGDAVIGLWSPEITGEDLNTATLRAAQCALALRDKFHHRELSQDLYLLFKLSIDAGQLATTHLGGVYGRWEFLTVGPSLKRAAITAHKAEFGDIILSTEAWELVQQHCSGQPWAQNHVRLLTLDTTLTPDAAPLPALSRQAEAALKGYLPGALLDQLTNIWSEEPAEALPITALFINLPDIDEGTPFEETQHAIRLLQTILYDYEGSVSKISIDYRGVCLMAVLGLPPVAHEDDPVLSVQAALAMQTELHKLAIRGAIGVASGMAFCGVVGNEQRSDYVTIGKAISLAEALAGAGHAPAHGRHRSGISGVSILCDSVTYLAARSQIPFEPLPHILVMGERQPIPIYRPILKML